MTLIRNNVVCPVGTLYHSWHPIDHQYNVWPVIIKTFNKSYEQPLSEHLQNCETLHDIVSFIFHNLLRYDITDLPISGEVQIKDGPLTTG